MIHGLSLFVNRSSGGHDFERLPCLASKCASFLPGFPINKTSKNRYFKHNVMAIHFQHGKLNVSLINEIAKYIRNSANVVGETANYRSRLLQRANNSRAVFA